jgi:hypothetical protein
VSDGTRNLLHLIIDSLDIIGFQQKITLATFLKTNNALTAQIKQVFIRIIFIACQRGKLTYDYK